MSRQSQFRCGCHRHSVDAGGTNTTIPSGVALAFFALFGTMAVAKHGFGKKTG